MAALSAGARALVYRATAELDEQHLAEEFAALNDDMPYAESAGDGESSHAKMMKAGVCEQAAAHRDLNRQNHLVPFDEFLLPCSLGYLNASLVTLLDSAPFVLAQGPMSLPADPADTRERFWAAVVESEMALVVSLAKFDAGCADYISAGTFGRARVEVVRTTHPAGRDLVVRSLAVTVRGPKGESAEPFKVEHVHLLSWPIFDVPDPGRALPWLLRRLIAHRGEGSDNWRALLHCSGGVGRTAALAAAVAVCEHAAVSAETAARLEQLAADAEADPGDAFPAAGARAELRHAMESAVKDLRAQRHPQAVETVGQYALAYKLVGLAVGHVAAREQLNDE